MLDHVILDVADYDRAKAFYTAALEPLGCGPLVEFEEGETTMCGFGRDRKATVWIARRPHDPRGGAHVAFEAASRTDVEAFHAAAVAAGGRDNGAPGLRRQYEPTYYAAYVLDPDGNNIEAVTHEPE